MAKKTARPVDSAAMARAASRTPVITLSDTEARLDMVKMRAYRLQRVRDELKRMDYGAAVLFDPINIRYATGSRNHTAFIFHFPSRYLFVPVDGPVILFEGDTYRPVGAGLETIDEIRPMIMTNFFFVGSRLDDMVRNWVTQITDLAKKYCKGNKRIAIDKCDPRMPGALADKGYKTFIAQEPLERARAIKSAEEIQCMNYALAVAESGMADMRAALRPGMTENELWSILYGKNIAKGGEWIDARLMSAGDRVNPWQQESSDRIIRPNELVAFDTDMVGPLGYCADISRTFLCHPGKPTKAQRELYTLAYEEVHHNIGLVKAGASFRDLAKKAFKPAKKYVKNRYPFIMHGIGMCDEWPGIPYQIDFPSYGYDGELQENMTLCVESYVGAEDGIEGVKLERQVLVTKDGCIPLDKFPFEEELLA